MTELTDPISSSAGSKIPVHEVGQACANSLRQYGVGTACIVRGGDRLGL